MIIIAVIPDHKARLAKDFFVAVIPKLPVTQVIRMWLDKRSGKKSKL